MNQAENHNEFTSSSLFSSGSWGGGLLVAVHLSQLFFKGDLSKARIVHLPCHWRLSSSRHPRLPFQCVFHAPSLPAPCPTHIHHASPYSRVTGPDRPTGLQFPQHRAGQRHMIGPTSSSVQSNVILLACAKSSPSPGSDSSASDWLLWSRVACPPARLRLPACLPASCYGGHRELRGPQGVLRNGRGGAGPGATGHPGERVAGGREERARPGLGGCGGRPRVRRPGRPKGRRAARASGRASLLERGLLHAAENLFLRPAPGEGEARKMHRVPHCGRKIGERERERVRPHSSPS